LVEIGLVVSEEKIFLISSPLFLFWAWRPSWLEVGINGHNFGRGPSKNHFSKVWLDRSALHSRWPLLLKIEISSNGQNRSILSQNMPKFELYKHNDELFNMYYRIFNFTEKPEYMLNYSLPCSCS
jgi:hypothetical protein